MSQLGFDALLAETDTINRNAAFEKEYGHLPATIEEALPFYRHLIARHHAAMLAADLDTVTALRREAHNLALRLNHGEPGIIAGPNAPGCVLEDRTAAEKDAIPQWGQTGSFIVEVGSMRVRIDMDGIFGIGAQYMPWMNFSARAVDWNKPFLSETGFRSFIGLYAPLVPNLTPDAFAKEVIASHVQKALKGKLPAIQGRFLPAAE